MSRKSTCVQFAEQFHTYIFSFWLVASICLWSSFKRMILYQFCFVPFALWITQRFDFKRNNFVLDTKNLQNHSFHFCPNNCGRRYKYKSGLNQHLKYECGVELQFCCPLCQRKFSHHSNLKRHYLITHQLTNFISGKWSIFPGY